VTLRGSSGSKKKGNEKERSSPKRSEYRYTDTGKRTVRSAEADSCVETKEKGDGRLEQFQIRKKTGS